MFAIGDDEWPGVSKLMEEMGEVQQVLGKIMGVSGATDHWSGDLRQMLHEELGDLIAAIDFLGSHCGLDTDAITARANFKRRRFEAWHRGEYCRGCGAMAVPDDPCVCHG